MMGLLGNVAECANLRHRLMKADYIQRFVELLDSESDGIEVSYNAAGILSHIGLSLIYNLIYCFNRKLLPLLIASDGPQYWQQYLPFDCKREDMLSRMRFAISRWKINSKRNINYRFVRKVRQLIEI